MIKLCICYIHNFFTVKRLSKTTIRLARDTNNSVDFYMSGIITHEALFVKST